MLLYSTGQLSLVPKVQPRHDLTQEVLGCETFLACALAPTSTKAVGSMRACMLSRFSRVQLFAIRLTVARQAPLSMGFSRQECWSVLSCPSARDLPNPRIEPESLMSPPWKISF